MSRLVYGEKSRDGVLGLAALIVAIAALAWSIVGSAGAAPTRIIVKKGDIAPGAVTTKALAKGAVTTSKLRKSAVTAAKVAGEAIHASDLASESVNRRVLKKESVGTPALANDAVTAAQIAPGSVYGGALGLISLQTKPIADLDQGAHNGEWTASNAETVLCAPGERLIGPGFAFTEAGDGQVSWLQALPYLNGPSQGVTGRIATDAGGAAKAEIGALCLK